MTIARPALTAVPLCVDLDGTYTRSDSSWDMLVTYLLSSPMATLKLALWAMKGRSHLKHELMAVVMPNVMTFPLNETVVDWIVAQAADRPVYLVSGAPQTLVDQLVTSSPHFKGGFGSTRTRNLVAHEKAQLLIEQFGQRGFDYVGNGAQDLPVWREARLAFAVDVPSHIKMRASSAGVILTELQKKPRVSVGAVLRSVRLPHVIKNLLCFVPLLAGHKWGEPRDWQLGTLTFLVLCVGAFLTYVLNDLRDLESDRQHRNKRTRPFAAGTLPSGFGLGFAAVLSTVWITLLALLPPQARAFSLLQVAASLIYSAWVKRVAVLDLIWLGLLYANRVIIGGLAIMLTPTPWLIGFTLFFFVGLASLKRFSEIAVVDVPTRLPGRGYTGQDRDMIRLMGYASSSISIVILAIYITQPDVSRQYNRPEALWLLGIVQFFWTSRTWLQASRGVVIEDPVLYVLKDRISRWSIAIAAFVFFAAVYK
jgi:4-hydroxybenzoate polyprenyltransferase